MSAEIRRRMRAAREHWIELDETHRICVLRPRFEDLRLFTGDAPSVFIAKFAVNWKGMTEADLLPSGGSMEVEFDADTCAEWLADKPEFSKKLADWLVEAGRERSKALDDAAKN